MAFKREHIKTFIIQRTSLFMKAVLEQVTIGQPDIRWQKGCKKLSWK